MSVALNLPRQIFGAGSLSLLPHGLVMLGACRPLLVSDRGVERAGLVDRADGVTERFLDVPENPTADCADAAVEMYRVGSCDSVVALGGGSVIDAAKIVAALAKLPDARASDIIGRPERITAVLPLIAIPTTAGTGSESSPVAAVHLGSGPAIGTRSPLLVPRVAICDPDLVRTLPPQLLAATAVDALSHCIEGFFAEPPNPVADALALDGAARVFASLQAALQPDGDDARASLMAAAFAGGAAIHKGLGPAHAIALTCGDQHVHHGTLIGVALPHTVRLIAPHVPEKIARLNAAIGLAGNDIADSIAELIRQLDLPATLSAAGYQIDDVDRLADSMAASHFNRTSPYVPTRDEYCCLLDAIAA